MDHHDDGALAPFCDGGDQVVGCAVRAAVWDDVQAERLAVVALIGLRT